MSRYRPGGYHPVYLGDTFKNGRYKIHHKLGWGGFSTVWLAKDKMREQWVSIKIITADSSKRSQELCTLQSLAEHSHGKLHSEYILQLQDDFLHHGPNGIHQCLVFELLGPTVDAVVGDIHYGGDVLEPETILRLSKQLLQAIDFLHEVGCAHGDLSGTNVSFTCWLVEIDRTGPLRSPWGPESEELIRRDGKPLGEGLPGQLVQAAGWDKWIDEAYEDIRVYDFGEAFLNGAEPKMLAQPGDLQAPKTIFLDSFDYRLDLWRAGILVYTFLFGAYPFQYIGDLDLLVAQMIYFVEDLPMEWQPKWDDIRLRSGWDHPIVDDHLPRSKLEQKFNDKIHEQTLKPLLRVIQGLVRFMPSDRVSASQALDMINSMNGTDDKAGEIRDGKFD